MCTPAATAAASLSRIAAQARRDVDQRDQQHHRHHDDRVAVERGVRRGDVGPADRADRQRVGGDPGEAAAAVREVDHVQDDRRRARGHQSDEGQVEPLQAQHRQPDHYRDRGGHRPGDQQDERERDRRPVGDPRRHPGADREQRDLTERDEADPPVEEPGAERDHRVDGDPGRNCQPVRARQRRHQDQRAGEQDGDHDGADERPALDPQAVGHRPRGLLHLRLGHGYRAVRATGITRWRWKISSAAIARTKGAMVR
jgi:hypothetical protein